MNGRSGGTLNKVGGGAQFTMRVSHRYGSVEYNRRMSEFASRRALRAPTQHQRGTRHRVSIVGVFGEILVTAGVLILLFVGWQLYWNDFVIANQQKNDAIALTESWTKQEPPAAAVPPALPGEPTALVAPPVLAVPTAEASKFAVLYVPRFGSDYRRTIVQGVDKATVLDVGNVGHYRGTQMPGEVGNFVLAAHRSAYGGGMHVNQLALGDSIVVQTPDGWYTYRFRNLEYVQPTKVDILKPVPGRTTSQASERLISLTTCNPLHSTAERVVAYGVFDSFQPTSAGPPAEIAKILAASGGQ